MFTIVSTSHMEVINMYILRCLDYTTQLVSYIEVIPDSNYVKINLNWTG